MPADLPPSHTTPLPDSPSILDRPRADRLREFRYRFGQAVVFGVPVLALQAFGRALGGPESDRWVTLFQALLAGWVVYVAAAGMMSEGVLMLLAYRWPAPSLLLDLLVALAAMAAYLLGLPRLVALLAPAAFTAARWPPTFHWTVILLAAWTGVGWWRRRKGLGRGNPGRGSSS